MQAPERTNFADYLLVFLNAIAASSFPTQSPIRLRRESYTCRNSHFNQYKKSQDQVRRISNLPKIISWKLNGYLRGRLAADSWTCSLRHPASSWWAHCRHSASLGENRGEICKVKIYLEISRRLTTRETILEELGVGTSFWLLAGVIYESLNQRPCLCSILRCCQF